MTSEKQKLTFQPLNPTTWARCILVFFKKPVAFLQSQRFDAPIYESLALIGVMNMVVTAAVYWRMKNFYLPGLVGVMIATLIIVCAACGILVLLKKFWQSSGSFQKYLGLLSFCLLLALPVNLLLILLAAPTAAYLAYLLTLMVLFAWAFYWRFLPQFKHFLIGYIGVSCLPFILIFLYGVFIDILQQHSLQGP